MWFAKQRGFMGISAKNRPCSLKNPSVNPQIHPNTRWSIRHNQWYHKVPNLESKQPQSLSGCSDWCSLAAPRRPSTWPPTWTWQIDFTSQPSRCQTQPGLTDFNLSDLSARSTSNESGCTSNLGSGAGSGARLLITSPGIQFLHVQSQH